VRIAIPEALQLAIDVFIRAAMRPEHAAMIGDHVLHAQAAGDAAGGLARVIALVEAFRERPPATEIAVTDMGRSSAIVDGGGHTGYVTSVLAMDKAIALARETGFGLVGLRNSWFSGQLAYYVERAASAGLIAIHCTNAKARVAPTGGVEAVLGTNPIAFGFPAEPEAIVIDIGTSAITVAELMMRQKLGQAMEPEVAVDRDGNPTTDPAAAWSGALMHWGGHRGYGIALAVQLFGILGGGATVVRDVAGSGFLFLVIDPALLMPLDDFKAHASNLVAHLERSRPAAGGDAVRVHGRGSARLRRESLARGTFEIEDSVHRTLLDMRAGIFAAPVLSNRKGSGP
jgi:LDH2 family malate/lactate/ureidoglycolate dehydrogenase